jgi:Sulfotransferase domain
VITVVSGLPRSGTSLMMQMIVAGGIPALTDGLRTADDNNPKGYFEWEAAKSLKQNPEAIAAAEGKVVKIISALLPHLPNGHAYRVVFMIRPLEEVVASQNKMLQRLGKDVPKTPMAGVLAAFEKHLKEAEGWLAKAPNINVLRIAHGAVIKDPGTEAARVAEFLGLRLDLAGMTRQVEQSLYREKSGLAIP